jgi:hypothetical protein
MVTSVWFDKMHGMRPSEALFWLKFWYREKSWQRGLQDERETKPQKPPFWALKRSYLAGYAHRERELAYDQALLTTRPQFYRPLEITASTEPSDYEWDAPEYWPPTPPPPLSAEQQAERDRIMRNSAALVVRPCWIFHKNDADPWPSRLHGHHNERALKLDAISGFIYSIQTRKHVQSLRRRELERIQYALLASKDFADRARGLIQSI